MASFQRQSVKAMARSTWLWNGGRRASIFTSAPVARQVQTLIRHAESVVPRNRPSYLPTTLTSSPKHDDAIRATQPAEGILRTPYTVGTQILHQTLVDHGVDKIFGVPYSSTSADAFSIIYESPDIATIVPRQEQSAGHMAEGYARATGNVGVVMATSAYAVTGLVTPMQDALSDGTPIIILIGDPDISPSPPRRDEFQRADAQSIATACTKWSSRVGSVEDLALKLSQAFHIATSGRPGPVLLEIPTSTLQSCVQRTKPKPTLGTPSIPPVSTSSFLSPNQDTDAALERVAKLIEQAEKPLLFVGQGMLATPQGPSILRDFVNKTNIPVTTSLQGLGAFNETDPRSLHMLGLHGTGYANMAIQNADLILALGARFDDRVTGHIPSFAPQALVASREGRGGIVHFDITLKNMNKVVQATEAVLGDCASNLARLTRRHFSPSDKTPTTARQDSSNGSIASTMPLMVAPPSRKEWYDQISSWKRRFPLSAYKNNDNPGSSPSSSSGSSSDNKTPSSSPRCSVIKPQFAIETLSNLVAAKEAEEEDEEEEAPSPCSSNPPPGILISTGVGQHQMWTALHYQFRHPRTLITSGGLGTMGYGLPAAIGAAAAAVAGVSSSSKKGKKKQEQQIVVDIDGDASFNMSLPELATAARYNLPVKVLLLDNGEMGMVSDIQRFYYEGRFSQNRHVNPDFVGVSRAMGVRAERVVDEADLRGKMEWLLWGSGPGPAVLDVVVERDTPVWPIVPAGRGLHEFVTYPEEVLE